MKERLMGKMLTFIARPSLLSVFAVFGLSCASTHYPGTASNAVSVILNNPEFKQYIHPEAKDRIPVIIVSNGLFRNDVDLSQVDYETKIVGSPTGKPNVVFNELETAEGLIHFKLTYDVEGVIYTGTLKVGEASIGFIGYEVSEK